MYNKFFYEPPEQGVDAMHLSVTQRQSLEVDVMEVWAKRAQQQQAALEAIKAYLR